MVVIEGVGVGLGPTPTGLAPTGQIILYASAGQWPTI